MMQKFVVAAVLLLALGVAGCATQQMAGSSPGMCDQLAAAGLSSEEMAKRGCCSHHGGVCGCNQATGMQRCCDGSDSPSCVCGE